MEQASILRRMQQKSPLHKNKEATAKTLIRHELLEALFKNSNLTAFKILFYLAKTGLEPKGERVLTFTLDLKKLNTHIGTDAKTIKRNLLSMQKTVVTFMSTEDENKVESYISMLPRVDIIVGKNLIEVDIYKKVFNLISNVKEKFSKVSIDSLLSINSIYAFRMLMLLERLDNYSGGYHKKQKTLNLDELNSIFATNYKGIKQFEQNVLLVAKKDLDNSISHLSFEWELDYDKNPSGRGRPFASKVIIMLTKTHKEARVKQVSRADEETKSLKQEPKTKKQYPNKGNAENIEFNKEMKEIAEKHELNEMDAIEYFTKFKNYYMSNNQSKANWIPMFENWILTGKKFEKPKTQSAIEDNFYKARLISEEVKGFIRRHGYSIGEITSGELEIEEIAFKPFPVPSKYGKGTETMFSFKNKAMNDKILEQYTTPMESNNYSVIEVIAE